MKFETFKAGVWQQRYQYKSFEPVLVDHEWLWQDPAINTLLEAANRALGELNAFSLIVPDIDLFIEMHVVKEAQTSSRIEGTQTGMDEALMPEDQIQPEKRDDWREVRNYVDAVNAAIAELATLPLSNRLLKRTHEILMRGVRGEHKQPGEFRTSQNWIGGSSLADAVFIPPHPDGVPAMMGDLEKFWHDETIQVPHLIRLAISHYQFETIHPFLDGNGRIGRLMITLYFVHAGVLNQPVLYLSDFFERNRSAYYDNLSRVRSQNDIRQWFRFFLVGVIETANKATNGLREILRLKKECLEVRIPRIGRQTQAAPKLLNHLFQQPIVWAEEVMKATGQSSPSAYKIMSDFERIGILREITGNKWGRIYRFEEYFKVFEG